MEPQQLPPRLMPPLLKNGGGRLHVRHGCPMCIRCLMHLLRSRSRPTVKRDHEPCGLCSPPSDRRQRYCQRRRATDRSLPSNGIPTRQTHLLSPYPFLLSPHLLSPVSPSPISSGGSLASVWRVRSVIAPLRALQPAEGDAHRAGEARLDARACARQGKRAKEGRAGVAGRLAAAWASDKHTPEVGPRAAVGGRGCCRVAPLHPCQAGREWWSRPADHQPRIRRR